MLSTLILASAAAALQPWDPWPEAADSAMVLALDTLDLVRGQLDFDRHWATGVHLADSTVLRAIQHVEQLPVILRESLEALGDPRGAVPARGEGLLPLLDLLEEADCGYSEAIGTLSPSRRDSLAATIPAVWLNEESPLDWEEWIATRGITSPLDDDVVMDMDTLAVLFESWRPVDGVDPVALTAAVLALRDAEWPAGIPVTLPGVEGTTVTFCFEGPVRYVVGGTGPNTYGPDCPFELIVDLGGNDAYGDGLGGAFGPAGRRIAVIVDLGGDDSYVSTSPVSQGCGIMGFGAIVDLDGNDLYRAADFSQGAGCMGQGLLVDLAGDDVQEGGTFSQGAGCLGTGLLDDGCGDDLRRVAMFGQGLGGTAGTGTLVDRDGCDVYLAGFAYSHAPLLPEDNQAMSQGFGMGLRPVIAGGIGLLADYGVCNDTYRAEVFGQGCSYYYSLGMLYDEGGQDSYTAAQYSQGTGIHLAAGCLWDGDGDDVFFSRNGPAQGSAHDLSTGFLIDGGGNDWYCSDGGQGFCLTNSATVFVDMEGADTYTVRGSGQGTTWWARGSSGVGVFLDLADDDVYLGSGSDSTRWTAGDYGVGVDLALTTPGGLNPQDPVGDPESLDLDSLFAVASEWEVGPNQERVAAHREELASRGEEAVAYLVANHMDTLDGLAMRAMEDTFRRSPDLSVELLLGLLDRVDSLTTREAGNMIYFLGVIADERTRLPLEAFLVDPAESLSVGMRANTVKAIGAIGNVASLPVLVPFAQDTSSRVRRQVAVTLGEMGDATILPVLGVLAADAGVDVRSAAEGAVEAVLSRVAEDAEEPEETI